MKSRQIALCSLLVALAIVCMILCGAIGIGTFAGPVLAMAVLLPVLEEYGPRMALTAYIATAILGFLVVPELELALIYAAFGWYPMLRPHLSRIPSRLLKTLLLVGICTVICLLLYGGLLRLLGMTSDLLAATPLFNLLLLAMGNLVFLLLDRALARLSFLWKNRLRNKLFR